MALTVTYTPDKDLLDQYGDVIFNSKWLAAWNPIVFKIQTDKFPTNTSDPQTIYSSVEDNGGRARFVIYSGYYPTYYRRGYYVTIDGTVYNGTYRVLDYDPYTASFTLDLTYAGDDSGTASKYYANYVISTKVYVGLPSGHKWEDLKPTALGDTLHQRPSDDGLTVVDISSVIQNDISTVNDFSLLSLPNDINLWTSFYIEYGEEYDSHVGIEPTTTETVAGLADDGGYLQLQIPTPNDINVGDYVVLGSSTDAYSGAVVRVIRKDTSNGDVTLDTAYTGSPTITAVSVYDLTMGRSTIVYTAEGTTYYAHNAKQLANAYGSNLAPYVNVDSGTNPDLADNLTSFERLGSFDLIQCFTAIIDNLFIDSLGVNDLPALEVVQYAQGDTVLSTDYYYTGNEEEGVYRFFFLNDITTPLVALYSLNFNQDILSQSFALADTFISMDVELPFSYMTGANLTYQYNTTDTWGSPLKSTTSLNTFNGYMAGKSTGYIRVVTSQASFYEGGVLLTVNYDGAPTGTTSLTIVMPANRLDQDIVIYTTDFQLSSLTSSQTGDQYRYGVFTDDLLGADWNTMSNNTALSSLTALNTELNSTTVKALRLWFTEGAANTGAPSKTITIAGTFADGTQQKILSVLDRYSDRTYRSALDGNGKIYDGTTDYDSVASWNDFAASQAFSVCFVVYLTSIPATRQTIFTTQAASTSGGFLTLYYDSSGLTFMYGTLDAGGANRDTAGFSNTLKIGYNVILFTYSGTALAGSSKAIVNGVRFDLNRNLTNYGGGSILNTNPLLIGTRQVATATYLTGRIRKLQIINSVATSAQLRAAYMAGSFEGIISDANFLLDIDFNQTGTNNLTTRASTPTYTITATGGAAYTDFMTP